MNKFFKGLAFSSAILLVLLTRAEAVGLLKPDLQKLDGEQSQITAVELASSSVSWDGSTLPSYPTGQPEVRIMKYSIAKGATLPLHQHPFINAGILLKGQLEVEKDDGSTLLLNAGDTIIELVQQWHLGKSVGDEDAEIIVFYAGIKGQPIVIKKDN